VQDGDVGADGEVEEVLRLVRGGDLGVSTVPGFSIMMATTMSRRAWTYSLVPP
jgi:hypothetical protein